MELYESLSLPGSFEWNKISHIGEHNIFLLKDSDASSQEYSDEVRVLHGWIEINSCIPSGNLHSLPVPKVDFKLVTVDCLYHVKVKLSMLLVLI